MDRDKKRRSPKTAFEPKEFGVGSSSLTAMRKAAEIASRLHPAFATNVDRDIFVVRHRIFKGYRVRPVVDSRLAGGALRKLSAKIYEGVLNKPTIKTRRG